MINKTKEAKERLAGCTCKTCKFFYPNKDSFRQLMGWRMGGACSKKHRNYFDFYIAQGAAYDSENDYCHKYIRGINDEKRKNS